MVDTFVGNDMVRHSRLYLFGNWIAELMHKAGEYDEYTLIVRNAGWHTATTYSRINDLLHAAGIPLTIGREGVQVYVYQYTSDTIAYLPAAGFQLHIDRNYSGATVHSAGEYSSQITCLWAFDKNALPELPRPEFQRVS